MKALITWFQKLLQRRSANGPAPTLQNSLPSSIPKSTPAPSTTKPVAASKPSLPSANRIELLAQIAEREIGKKETKNNVGAEVRKYQAATNLDPGAWPWCAAFVCWSLDQWLTNPDNRTWLALKSTTPAKWRPRTALAFGLLKWAQARPATVQVLPDTAIPRAGDIVVYDFSHCGIVSGVTGDKMLVVEGNTTAPRKDGTASREGDGVYWKTRPRHLAQAFLRIRPSGSY